MSELCRRQIIRQQQIMKKSALTVLIALLPLAAIAQTPSINEDGKKIEKEKMIKKGIKPLPHKMELLKSGPVWYNNDAIQFKL